MVDDVPICAIRGSDRMGAINFEGVTGTVVKVVVIALMLAAFLAPKLGFRVPRWLRVVEVIAGVLWVAVAGLAIYGALLYFKVI